MNLPTEEIGWVNAIRPIDEAAEYLDTSLETMSGKIDPETEFWGHCSNAI